MQQCTGGVCKRTCRSDDLDCYVLDNNGYVVISKEPYQTGRFFGEIDGTVMDSLVYSQVYQRIRVYDYQAVCLDAVSTKNSASFLLTVSTFIFEKTFPRTCYLHIFFYWNSLGDLLNGRCTGLSAGRRGCFCRLNWPRSSTLSGPNPWRSNKILKRKKRKIPVN